MIKLDIAVFSQFILFTLSDCGVSMRTVSLVVEATTPEHKGEFIEEYCNS
jgi:hypothetical protein